MSIHNKKSRSKNPDDKGVDYFDDFSEDAERKEYLMFCAEFGPLYSRSYIFFILSIFIFFILSLFCYKWFFIFIFLNYISWNTGMSYDWEEFHGQLDDIEEVSLNDLDLDIRGLFSIYIMYIYKKAGIIAYKSTQLTKYCSYLYIYDKEKINNDFYKIIIKKNKLLYKKKIKKIKQKNKIIDIILLKNYRYKNNVIFKKNNIKKLHNINTKISNNLNYHYYKKNNKNLFVYTKRFLLNYSNSWVSFNNFIKEYYRYK